MGRLSALMADGANLSGTERGVVVVEKMHPEIATFLTQRAQVMGQDELIDMPLALGRQIFRDRWFFERGPLPGCTVHDEVLPRKGIACRIYTPQGQDDPAETILFIHGGGWTFGDLDSHDLLLRNLCETNAARVVGVAYRLAPETPHPGPVEDCVLAARWIKGRFKPARLILGGDSAGANLALSSAIELVQVGSGAPSVDALMLLYGCYRPEFDSDSYTAYGDGRFGLSERAMRRYWCNYLDQADGAMYQQQILSGLAGLPPVFLGVAVLDLLRDDSVWLASQLRGAGVPHALRLWSGCPHGFMQLPAALSPVGAALQQVAEGMRGLRNPPRPCD